MSTKSGLASTDTIYIYQDLEDESGDLTCRITGGLSGVEMSADGKWKRAYLTMPRSEMEALRDVLCEALGVPDQESR